MLTVTEEYKTAVNADTRQWRARAEVYFNGPGSAPTTFYDGDISTIELLEEAHADGVLPTGAVSSNELVLSLDNHDRKFTPTNTESPYYGNLSPGIQIKAWLELKVGAGWEAIPLGTFKGDYWDAPSMSTVATISCYDKLHDIGNKEMPLIPLQENITLYEAFETLFGALGLTPAEYNIDAALSGTQLRFCWYQEGLVKNTLQSMSTAGPCSIGVDRNNVIQVKSLLDYGTSVATLNDEEQVVAAVLPQRYNELRSIVRVKFYHLDIKEEDQVVFSENFEISQGTNTFSIVFDEEPLALLSQIKFIDTEDVNITNLEAGSWGANITLESGRPDIIGIEIVGRLVNKIKHVVESVDSSLVAQIGERPLIVDSTWIQSKELASTYVTNIKKLVSEPYPKIESPIRANPALEIFDTVTFVDPSDKIPSMDIVIRRSVLRYAGGLEGEIYAIKKDILV